MNVLFMIYLANNDRDIISEEITLFLGMVNRRINLKTLEELS
jgi:hypothetical protein